MVRGIHGLKSIKNRKTSGGKKNHIHTDQRYFLSSLFSQDNVKAL